MGKNGKTVSTLGYDRLTLSFKAMGGGLWDYAIESDDLYCNERWYEIMGLSSVNDPVTSVANLNAHIHPEDLASATAVDLEQAAQMLLTDERYHVEFRIVRPDGEVRWVRSVACIVRDNAGELRAVGCITDITEFRVQGVEPHNWNASPDANARAPAAPGPAQDKAPGPSPKDPLSERERECLLWVSMGKTAWETASILNLSQRTIEFHLKNAIRKLNAANKIHAVTIAIRIGLL